MDDDRVEKKAMNCWEHKKCGREPGGFGAREHGVCPASTKEKLDGVHRGAGMRVLI